MLGILGDIRVRTARVMGVVGVGFDNQHLGSLGCNQSMSRLACCRNRSKRGRVDLVVERAMFNDSRIGAEVVS